MALLKRIKETVKSTVQEAATNAKNAAVQTVVSKVTPKANNVPTVKTTSVENANNKGFDFKKWLPWIIGGSAAIVLGAVLLSGGSKKSKRR